MHRALSVVYRQANTLRNGSLRVVKQRAQRPFSSTSRVLEGEAASSSSSTQPKKRGFFRTVALYTSGFLVLFYAGSPLVAFNNERYKDFFFESVPFGEMILEYSEENGIDDKLRIAFFQSTKESMQKAQAAVTKKAEEVRPSQDQTEKTKQTIREKAAAAKSATVEKVKEAKEKAKEVTKDSKERASEVAQLMKTQTSKAAASASQAARSALGTAESAKDAVVNGKRPSSFSEGLESLVQEVEAALAGKPTDYLPDATTTPEQPAGVPPDMSHPSESAPSSGKPDGKLYTAELPLGFEPPPGYARPKPPAPTPSSSTPFAGTSSDEIPLLAVAVADVASSEPAIAELASTIDSLTSYLKSTPGAASKTAGIINTARDDLKQLAERIETSRVEERTKLEAKLDEQAREYSMKLLETELAGQDKLDEQEMEFRAFFEDDRRKTIQAYREKLDAELKTQSEIINERLKAEVIAQGIEMQRRWIREIKVHVEEERGGRLSKLDELATNLKRLERVTLDNAEYLNENLRLHALWAAFRAFTSAAVGSNARKPFRDELRVLRHASGAKDDELVNSVLDSLEGTDVPDVGVEPLSDLTTWFTSSVAPQVAKVALVPEQDAGVLSYVASYLFSTVQFRRHGLVDGRDVLSVLSRAEHYLIEKDLDSATRELNQLKGAPKSLLKDWLDAARRRLEVLQAIEVVEAQATLASLLVV